jgi:hypothetical protein
MAPLDANPAKPPCANAVTGNEKATKAKAIFSAVFIIENSVQVHLSASGLM